MSNPAKCYAVQRQGPHGWEDLYVEDTLDKAQGRLWEHEENEPGVVLRISRRRREEGDRGGPGPLAPAADAADAAPGAGAGAERLDADEPAGPECGRVVTIPRNARLGPPVEDVRCRLPAGHAGDHEGEAESAGPITWENTGRAG